MSLYKDLNNKIHDDMDGTALHLLPTGCVLITQAEADILRAPTAAEVLAANNAKALAELAAIDAGSIRAMREYIASKADAPQILKDKESAAQASRLKIK